MTRRLRDPAQTDLAPLEQDSRYSKVREELTALEKRYAESEKRLQVAKARGRGQAPTRTLAERATALLKGGTIVSLPPASEAEAASEELDILAKAIVTKREQLAALASEISFEVCQRFAAQNAEALRAALQAVTDLYQALEVTRVIRGRLIGAGYQLNESAIAVPRFISADVFSALGDPERHSNTPAGRFRDWLSERGII